jgi:hypothetical protein
VNLRLVPAVGALVLFTAACGLEAADSAPAPEYDYVTMCVDPGPTSGEDDDVRVDDDDPRCPDALNADGSSHYDSGGGHGFMYVFVNTGSGYTAPPVGSRVGKHAAITRTFPAGASASKVGVKAVPKAGSVVTRGGFGVSSGGSKGGSSGS